MPYATAVLMKTLNASKTRLRNYDDNMSKQGRKLTDRNKNKPDKDTSKNQKIIAKISKIRTAVNQNKKTRAIQETNPAEAITSIFSTLTHQATTVIPTLKKPIASKPQNTIQTNINTKEKKQ